MNAYKCGACSEPLADGARCTACHQELHFHCAGISEAGYNKLGNRKLTWRCPKCKQASQPSSPRVEPESLILKEIRAINEKLVPLDCLKDEITALRAEFLELKTSLNDTNKELKEFNSRMKDLENRLVQVEKAQSQIDLIQARLEQLEQESNSGEQWARLNNIEIKGVPQANNENLIEVVQKIGSYIQYPVTKSQINFVTRVPTREKERTKTIIASFCNRYVKEDFIAAAKLMSKTNPLTSGFMGFSGSHRIYVNDHLTVRNKALLMKTKKAAAAKNFRYVWVKHAKIHARQSDGSHTIIVKTEKDLVKIA